MTQTNAIRQVANDFLAQYNRLACRGQAATLELQTECVLEALAEVAHRCGQNELYRQITDRQHQLEQHTVLAPITAMGVQG
ncbi:hypothetical protein [Zobellella sp. An-6]|uniref:hypothetical protein n=1 Tax=Zobellella sp. An-6 TaxID=3400218 RepID=UPI004041563C